MPNPASPLLQRPDQRYWLEKIYQSDPLAQGEHKRIYPYPSNTAIPMELERIWVVSRGVVQLNVLHPSGDEVILGLVTPLMPFGMELSFLAAYSARTLTPVELLSFSWIEIESSPDLCQNLLRSMVHRLSQTEAILAISSHRRVEDRLRNFLLLLKQELGQPTPQGFRLNVKLTHQQIASAIGTSRVTITRLLGKLRAEKWVKMSSDRHLVITTKATFS
jgi:CRP-like cAMP-binding protein